MATKTKKPVKHGYVLQERSTGRFYCSERFSTNGGWGLVITDASWWDAVIEATAVAHQLQLDADKYYIRSVRLDGDLKPTTTISSYQIEYDSFVLESSPVPKVDYKKMLLSVLEKLENDGGFDPETHGSIDAWLNIAGLGSVSDWYTSYRQTEKDRAAKLREEALNKLTAEEIEAIRKLGV
jgi:hypothetical protein